MAPGSMSPLALKPATPVCGKIVLTEKGTRFTKQGAILVLETRVAFSVLKLTR